MKMNNILKTAIVLLGASTLMSGCIKETFPLEGVATEEQVNESPYATSGLVSAIYTSLITNYIGIGDHFDFGYPGIFGATDRAVGEVFPVSGNLEGGNVYMDRWQPWQYNIALGPTGAVTPFTWYNYYSFIKCANDAIRGTKNSTTEAGKQNYGLAKAFRALFYLDMARMYDPLPAKAPARQSYEAELEKVKGLTVPIVTEELTQEEATNNPRATREEMFEFILQDLEDAEELLQNYKQTSVSVPSLAVVYGLKARTYLWLGGFTETYENVPTGNDAYRLAAEYARKAINTSGCQIMNESTWLGTGFNLQNNSWMWGMVQSTDTVLNNLLSWAAHMSLEAVYGYGYGAQPGIQVASYDRLSNTDFRKRVFVGPDRKYSKYSDLTSLTEEEFETIAPYASFKFHTNGQEKTNYTTANVVDIPLMRVEEMYFIEAEATAHYDEATARTLLTSFMANRDPSYKIPAAYTLVDEIMFQKRIEFWGEGIIYFDFKRLNMSMQNGNPGTNAPLEARFNTDGRAPWWNFCIPQSETQSNTALAGNNNPDPTQTVTSNDD